MPSEIEFHPSPEWQEQVRRAAAGEPSSIQIIPAPQESEDAREPSHDE